MKDFNDHAFIGFWFAMIILPMTLASKEDNVSPEAFSGDSSDPNQLEKMFQSSRKVVEKVIQHETQVKVMLRGAFLDMVKRGIFK